MVVGYLIIGMLAGLLAFATALLLGMSFWPALLLYSGVGGGAILAAAATHLIVARFSGKSSAQTADGEAEIDLHRPTLEPEPTRSGLPRHAPHGAMKILAVDDDPSLLELIPMIAAEADFTEVTTVSSGALALEVIEEAIEKEEAAFDCFLLDITMPGMDGIDLCARIRQIPVYSRTPIIMLTAMRDMEFLDRAFKAGATDYATKPFDITELGDRLREAHEDVIARKQHGVKPQASDALSVVAATDRDVALLHKTGEGFMS